MHDRSVVPDDHVTRLVPVNGHSIPGLLDMSQQLCDQGLACSIFQSFNAVNIGSNVEVLRSRPSRLVSSFQQGQAEIGLGSYLPARPLMGLGQLVLAQWELAGIGILEVLRHDGFARVEQGVVGHETLDLLLCRVWELIISSSRIGVLKSWHKVSFKVRGLLNMHACIPR